MYTSPTKKDSSSHYLLSSDRSKGEEKEREERKTSVENVNGTRRQTLLWIMTRDSVVIISTIFILAHIYELGSSSEVKVVSSLAMSQAASLPPSPILTTRSHRGSNESFFHSEPDTYLADFPSGNLYDLFEEADRHQNAFLMYYATWDGDSLHSRRVINKVAEIFHLAEEGIVVKELFIGAINCWMPSGDCAKVYAYKSGSGTTKHGRRLEQFPLFIFYPRDNKGIQYDGPITVADILEFLHHAISPVKQLTTVDDWHSLRAQHGGCTLVGYFPNLYQDARSYKEFKSFLATSRLMLGVDPFRTSLGGIGVVIDPKLAFHMHLNASSAIAKLTFWNGTSASFPRKTLLPSSDVLFKWVKTKMFAVRMLSYWVGASGRKSTLFSKYLKSGSGMSLLVFLQKTRGQGDSDYLNLVKATSLKYRTCANHNWTLSQESMYSAWTRQDAEDQWTTSDCTSDGWSAGQRPSFAYCYNSTVDHERDVLKSYSFSRSTLEPRTSSWIAAQKIRSRHNLGQSCCHYHGRHSLNFLYPSEDVNGLGCIGNRTLNFYIVNVETQSHLVQNLGLKLSNGVPSAVIVSLPDETVFATGNLTLTNFIKTFHVNPEVLPKVKLSAVRHAPQPKCDIGKTSCLEVINSSNFENVVMDPTKNVVLLYRTDFCAFCTAASSAAQVFHSVQSIFQRDSSWDDLNLRFVTIDAASNDLPWQFTALSVPTVLFFPSMENATKHDTRALPASEALTVVNLLNFVIANLEPAARMKFAIRRCLRSAECFRWMSRDYPKRSAAVIKSAGHLRDEL